MYCSKCGKKLIDGTNKCPDCMPNKENSLINAMVSKIIMVVGIFVSVIMLILTCVTWSKPDDIFINDSAIFWNTESKFEESFDDEPDYMIEGEEDNIRNGPYCFKVSYVLVGVGYLFVIDSVISLIKGKKYYQNHMIIFSILLFIAMIAFLKGMGKWYNNDFWNVTVIPYIEIVLSLVCLGCSIASKLIEKQRK